jgi:hypothetical protein
MQCLWPHFHKCDSPGWQEKHEYIYIHTHTHTHTYTYMLVCMYTYIHIYLHTCSGCEITFTQATAMACRRKTNWSSCSMPHPRCVGLCAYVSYHTYYTYVSVCVCICMYIHIYCIEECVYAYMHYLHTYKHTNTGWPQNCSQTS